MAKRLQELPQATTILAGDSYILMKDGRTGSQQDYKILADHFLAGKLDKTSMVDIGQAPVIGAGVRMIDNGAGIPALPVLSGKNLTQLEGAISSGTVTNRGLVYLSDSITSGATASSNKTAATPFAVRELNNRKADLSGAAFTGPITTTSTIDGRDVAADGVVLDNLAAGDFEMTAAEILTKLKTVDGSGSGLDADKLDNLNSSQFLRSDVSDTFTGDLTVTDDIVLNTNNESILFGRETGGNLRVLTKMDNTNSVVSGDSNVPLKLQSNGTITHNNQKVWTAGNDGAGSLLDADKLDGLHASQFARYSDAGTVSNALANGAWVTNGGSSSNVDHIWHDDTNNEYNFCSDVAFKAPANAGINAGRVRATTTSGLTLTSVGHALQTGSSTTTNLAIDNNEIQGRNNGAASMLHLNRLGGTVYVNNSEVMTEASYPQNLGQLGTYAWLVLTDVGVSVDVGDVINGSRLRYTGQKIASYVALSQGTGTAGSSTTALAGTWQAMGYSSTTSSNYSTTLFQRVT